MKKHSTAAGRARATRSPKRHGSLQRKTDVGSPEGEARPAGALVAMFARQGVQRMNSGAPLMVPPPGPEAVTSSALQRHHSIDSSQVASSAAASQRATNAFQTMLNAVSPPPRRSSALSPNGMDDVRESLEREAVNPALRTARSTSSSDTDAEGDDDGCRAFLSQTQPRRPYMDSFGILPAPPPLRFPVAASSVLGDTQDGGGTQAFTQDAAPLRRAAAVPPKVDDTRAAHRTRSRLGLDDAGPPPLASARSAAQKTLNEFVRIPGTNVNPFLPARSIPKRANALKKAEALERLLKKGNADGKPAYMVLFQEVGKLGSGSFSDVFRARCRMDGVTYAVKRRRAEVRLRQDGGQSRAEQRELREVQAMAALTTCPNLIRYFSAWREDDHLYIQTELAWGSVEDAVLGRRPTLISATTALAAGGTGFIDNAPSTHSIGRPPSAVDCGSEDDSKPPTADGERQAGGRARRVASQESFFTDTELSQTRVRAPPRPIRRVPADSQSMPAPAPMPSGPRSLAAGLKRPHRQVSLDEMFSQPAEILVPPTFVPPSAPASMPDSADAAGESTSASELQSPRRRPRMDPPKEDVACRHLSRAASVGSGMSWVPARSYSGASTSTMHGAAAGRTPASLADGQPQRSGSPIGFGAVSRTLSAGFAHAARSAVHRADSSFMPGSPPAQLAAPATQENTQDLASAMFARPALHVESERHRRASVASATSEGVPVRQGDADAHGLPTRQVSFGSVRMSVMASEDSLFGEVDATSQTSLRSVPAHRNDGASVTPVERSRIRLSEADSLQVLRDIAAALAFMHARSLAHLDVKPANMLIVYEGGPAMCDVDGQWVPEAAMLTGLTSTDSAVATAAWQAEATGTLLRVSDLAGPSLYPDAIASLPISSMRLQLIGRPVYKLGDLGQVAPFGSSDVEEGDCRYLSRELLGGDASNLAAADVFALGISMVELLTGLPLPAGDDAYHALRDGTLPLMELQHVSASLRELIARMMHPDAALRPTAQEILLHPLVQALGAATPAVNEPEATTPAEVASDPAPAAAIGASPAGQLLRRVLGTYEPTPANATSPAMPAAPGLSGVRTPDGPLPPAGDAASLTSPVFDSATPACKPKDDVHAAMSAPGDGQFGVTSRVSVASDPGIVRHTPWKPGAGSASPDPATAERAMMLDAAAVVRLEAVLSSLLAGKVPTELRDVLSDVAPKVRTDTCVSSLVA